jgi:hypothetical protein
MAQKIWTIIKDVLFILIVVSVLLFALLVAFWHIPKDTVPFSVTINAIRITEPGEPSGTIPITIEGNYIERFFSDSRRQYDELELTISPLDGLTDFVPSGIDTDRGKVICDSHNENRRTHYYAYKDGRPYSVNISFSKDFCNWLISVSKWDTFEGGSQVIAYYMGSTDENATLEDLCEVFAPFDYKLVWQTQNAD